MRTNYTELVFIIDKSGSMAGLEADTIGGFNSMLKRQRDGEGKAVITTVLFDDGYEILHDRIDISGVEPIGERDYCVGGSTALLDAIGETIAKIDNVQKNTKENHRADKVLFVIITDGEENSSSKFGYSEIKNMIKMHKSEHDWEFIFLGANIDAVKTAETYGIKANRAATYKPNSRGTKLNYEVMSDVICDLRASKEINQEWKQKIESE